jgi:bifunctional UDP-N-acetylglucosamine pyrophosphorylase/glucosamine-1-phosphate N-acetyltransferase
MTTLSIVILAAGKGTRMHSDLPKVLQPLSKKPIIHYVYETANSLNPNEIAMVVGHKMELIKASINDKKIKWATQKKTIGYRTRSSSSRILYQG